MNALQNFVGVGGVPPAMRALLLLGVVLVSLPASAFCGFYVSGAGGKLFNDASMVVLVRDGTRTVLSMQNNYRGPVQNFALVVPVPVVLSKENVKTIPREAFTRIDELTAPRLVELPKEACFANANAGSGIALGLGGFAGIDQLGVRVEATFEVEEYEVVVLSAEDSMGLERWLKANKYKIPEGAAELLRPYVQTNSKFFVARVNAKKAKFEDGQLQLSPLRFAYDSEQFSLPVRLGLVNSGGTQDLIVNIVAKDRYELANMKNVLVPTNVEVSTRAGPQFGGFYKELLARTFAENPGAAVTEYAWRGALRSPDAPQGIYGVTCDPCPPPSPVDDALTKTLGADSIPGLKTDEDIAKFAKDATLTRIHLRYTKDSLTDDLVFTAAEAVAGGVPEVAKAGPAKSNRFQGRYIVKKPFDVNMCSRGFGASQGAYTPSSTGLAGTGGVQAKSTKLPAAFESYLRSDIAELGVKAGTPAKK